MAGNWKMNGNLAANAALVEAILRGLPAGPECAVCVPYPYLAQVGGLVKGSRVQLGAQTLSEHASGAYTGEVAGSMLAELGCRIVLVGHSERRAIYGETDAQVAAKFKAAQAAGLVPMLCVGETLAEREANSTLAVVQRHVESGLNGVTAEQMAKKLKINYQDQDDLYTQDINLTIGAHYFAQQLKAFEGNLVMALAAYNAGPTKLRSWKLEPYGKEQDELVASIPLAETRGYVKNVLWHYRFYKKLQSIKRFLNGDPTL